MDTITLAELPSSNVEILPHEAVAVALGLLSTDVDDLSEARAPYGPPSLDTVAIDPAGHLHCRCTAATPSVPEVAILMNELLACGGARVPGGLRYALGRALLEVEAPPFDSRAEFASALERFGQGDRTEVLSSLYARAHQHASTDIVPAARVDAVPAFLERRRSGSATTELRRQLRETDLRLYEVTQGRRAATADGSTQRSVFGRRAPLAACMVAGLAIVAFGEIAHVTRPDTPVRTDDTRATGARSATDRTLDVATDSGASNAETDANDARVAPTTMRTGPGATPAARTASAPARSASARAASPAEVRHAARETPRAGRPKAAATRSTRTGNDSHRGVLARIRFEWDNPFK